MKNFPMFLKVAGRSVVIIGGGEQAAQKSRLALKTEAEIFVVAEELDPELSDLVQSGRVRHVETATQGLLGKAVIVFVATGCKGADTCWHMLAKAAGALVNVVDYPDLCDAITPSIVDRDPVVVAIGTEGTAPVLGRRLKSRIEEILHPRLGAYAALAGRLRGEVAQRVPHKDRRSFWAWAFTGSPWTKFSVGNEQEAAREIKQTIRDGGTGADAARLTAILSVSEEADLLPLRAVQRMQEADAIYADRTVSDAVLELARRDAERIRTGQPEGTVALRTDLMAPMREHAARGARIVYLTSEHDLESAAPDDAIPFEQIRCASLPELAPLPSQACVNA
ncbi:MAG: NAD(P)-dependent oxidoreductase [Pseudomonadota bacterium]